MVNICSSLPLFLLALAGSASAQMNQTVDDTDSAVTYSTSPAWNTGIWAQQSPQPLDDTNHGTPNPGASMTFKFTGTAVYVYGYKNTDHGFRNIVIDSGREIQCDGRTGQLGSRSLVFSTSGLSDGPHTISITHTGTQGQYLNIDYFFVTSGGSKTSSASPTSTTSTNSDSHGSSIPVAAIAGGAAGGGVLLTCLLFGICLAIRRRRRKSQLQTDSAAALQKSPPPINRPYSYSIADPPSAKTFASTKSMVGPRLSYYDETSSPDADASLAYNPYNHPHNIAQLSPQYAGSQSASAYSNPIMETLRTLPSRPMSDESRPLSTASHPTSRASGSYNHNGGPLVMSYDPHVENAQYTHQPAPFSSGKGGFSHSPSQGQPSVAGTPSVAPSQTHSNPASGSLPPPPEYTERSRA